MGLRHIFILIFIVMINFLQAQSKTEACHHISELQEGTLLIRLESNQKKISAMENLIAEAKDSPLKGKTKKDLLELRTTTDDNNRLLVEGFSKAYNYSRVLFIYDSDYRDLLENKNYDKFLNSNLEYITESFVPEQSYLARIGTTDVNGGGSTKSIVIADLNGNDLMKPFPNTLKYEGGIFEALFSGDLQGVRRAERLSTKLQKKFVNHAKKCFISTY